MGYDRTSDKVLKKIQEKIFSGELKPGQRIMSEIKIAEELKVSRVSVREAIEKLVAFNILSKKKGGGTFINDLGPSIYLSNLLPMLILDKNNYMDILEFRLIMEPETAKLCTERCDDRLIEELEVIYNNMTTYRNDKERFAREDLNFHTKIAEGTKNSLIIKVNEIFSDVLECHQRVLYENLGPNGGVHEHKLILDSIKNRDSELAFIYARRHAVRTINNLKDLEQKKLGS